MHGRSCMCQDQACTNGSKSALLHAFAAWPPLKIAFSLWSVLGKAAGTKKGGAHLGEEARVGQAGDHAHDLAHGAHLLDVGQLLVQDAHREIALTQAVHQLLLHCILWYRLLHAPAHHSISTEYSHNESIHCASLTNNSVDTSIRKQRNHDSNAQQGCLW